jgi:hypothetical protein
MVHYLQSTEFRENAIEQLVNYPRKSTLALSLWLYLVFVLSYAFYVAQDFVVYYEREKNFLVM